MASYGTIGQKESRTPMATYVGERVNQILAEAQLRISVVWEMGIEDKICCLMVVQCIKVPVL